MFRGQHTLDPVGVLRHHRVASMTDMSRLGSPPSRGLLLGSVRFDRDFGGRSRRAEKPLLGRPLLVTEPTFEPSILLAQAINLLLLFQAFGAVAQPMIFRGSGLRFRTALLTMLLQQPGSEFIEQGLDSPTILQGALEQGNQVLGHIHAAAFAVLGEGEDESRVLLAAGASLTAGSQAGFADLGQGALDGRPELGDVPEKELLGRGVGGRSAAHVYGILYHIPYCKQKNRTFCGGATIQPSPFKTEGLHFFG